MDMVVDKDTVADTVVDTVVDMAMVEMVDMVDTDMEIIM